MFGFTRQERAIVVFLTVTFLLGLGVSLVKRAAAPKLPVASNASMFERQVARMDSVSGAERGAAPVAIANRGESAGAEKAQTDSGHAISRVNINTASKETLLSIPRIGPVLAQKIIDYRHKNGHFKVIHELTNIDGIGEKTLEKIKPYVSVK